MSNTADFERELYRGSRLLTHPCENAAALAQKALGRVPFYRDGQQAMRDIVPEVLPMAGASARERDEPKEANPYATSADYQRLAWEAGWLARDFDLTWDAHASQRP